MHLTASKNSNNTIVGGSGGDKSIFEDGGYLLIGGTGDDYDIIIASLSGNLSFTFYLQMPPSYKKSTARSYI